MSFSRLSRGVLASLIVALLGTLGVVSAQPPGQATATPMPTPLAVPPLGVPTEADLIALAEAVRQENLSWENITFWQGEALGDAALSDLALAVAIGDELPDFEVPLLDGGTFRLADETGALLVNFWASWCGPCRDEIPYLLDMQADPEAPFALVLVNIFDDVNGYRTLAEEEFPAELRSGRAPDGALVETLGIHAVPVSVLLDDEQQVQAIHVGNITPTVVDFLYALAGDAVPSAEEPPSDPTEPIPAELLDEVAQANDQGGAVTVWAGGTLGAIVPPPIDMTVGEKLPAFGLVSIAGETFISDLAEQPMLFNFWASWCGPCVAEFPLLIEHSQPTGAPFRVAFVNVWDDPVTARQFLAAYPEDILVLLDADNTLPDLYGLDLVPVSVVADARGLIVAIQIGPVNEAFLRLADTLIQRQS